MTFRWARTPGTIRATCDTCGTVLTSRTESELLREQRRHYAWLCIERQRAARVASMAESRRIARELAS